MKDYRKLTLSLIAGWFVVALCASAMGAFRNDANRFGPAVAIGALAPMVVFLVWYRTSTRFRQWTMSLDPALLTSLQAWRVMGFTFVLLEAHGLLPALFAFPAGFGDMAVGATAAFTAWKLAYPARRNRFILWQTLGIMDLVTAVTLGTTVGLIEPHSVAVTPMTVLPLSLIPTFLVPLFLMFHMICIAQARTWKVAERGSRFTTPVQHLAN
jgi:hypothetical protein